MCDEAVLFEQQRTENDLQRRLLNLNLPGMRTTARACKLSEIPPNRRVNSNLPLLSVGWRAELSAEHPRAG